MRYRIKLATWTVVREQNAPSPHTLSSARAIGLLAHDLAQANDDDREHLWGLYCGPRYHLRFVRLVSVGSLTASIVHPREVFGPAIREGIDALAVVHNHPSGDPSPSHEDLVVTERLLRCGELLGIRLIDHLIIGNGTGDWTSLRDHSATMGEGQSLWS